MLSLSLNLESLSLSIIHWHVKQLHSIFNWKIFLFKYKNKFTVFNPNNIFFVNGSLKILSYFLIYSYLLISLKHWIHTILLFQKFLAFFIFLKNLFKHYFICFVYNLYKYMMEIYKNIIFWLIYLLLLLLLLKLLL
jgi:hypothetical protein